MTEVQLTVWMATLLVVMFCAGCSFGYGYSRNKARKVSHARKR